MSAAEPRTPSAYDAHRDEMLDGDGSARPGWAPVQEHLAASDPEEMRLQGTRISRRLHSHGATFEVPGEPARRWPLDPIPMVIDRVEWAALGRALSQRATVLEAVLADVLGEQRLLRSGELPTDAVVAHRDLLRPCIGVPAAGGRHLVLHAADVARRRDGSFVVLADRTQAPSGAGFALENREVLSNTSGDLLRRCGVEPLRPWFSVLRRTLAEVAPPGVDDPRVVILTPGPMSETHFEHGLLSRTLGYTLVEPADLTVRDGHVFLKSVTGLEPVHVLWRRIDAEWCDSLELRADSLLGVPGLVEAARRRNVSIVNPLGSGLAESPALAPYLPRLTRLLLGEDPLVEQAPTWWCGDPAGRSHVLHHLHELVVKPIDRGRAHQSTFGRCLSRAQLDALSDRIRAEPHLWVGQEEQPLSHAPSVDGDEVVAHHVVMRAMLVANGEGFSWMDGGLTRSAPHAEAVTMSRGAAAKDTWVVAPPSERSWSAGRTISLPQVDLRDSVTSSAASSLYWMGRNHERAEVVIRSVAAVEEELRLWPELPREADGEWVDRATRAVQALALDGDEPGDRGPLGGSTFDSTLVGALTDPDAPRSVATSLHHLLVASRSVRERFSTDAARMLGELELAGARLASAAPLEAREVAEQLVAPLSALAGLIGESMVRDAGWRFLDLGRRLERAELLTRLLAATMLHAEPDPVAAPLRETVLAGWDCLGAYRRRHRSDVEPATMLALLLHDPSNPRSMAFQLARAGEDLSALPDRGAPADRPALVVAGLVAALDGCTPAIVARADADGRRPALAELLERLSEGLARLGRRVELDYVAQVGPTTVLGEDPWRRR